MMHSRKTPWRLIALISLIVVIAAWSLAFWQSRQVERRLFADTGRRMQTIAETHAAQAALSLAIADESLKRLQDTLRRDGEAAFGRVGSNMSLPESAGGAINRVALIGKNGRMTQNFLNGESVVLLDVSDREYFKTFRDDPRDRIFFTEPIRGKASGEWIILFARPVLKDGQFAGVIFVGIGVSQFAKLVNTSGENGLLITLLSPGSRVIARSESSEEAIGREVSLPPELLNTRFFDWLSPVDGITRRFAARSVPEWGMRVIVGMDHRTVQEVVAGYTRIAMIPALLLTFLLLPAAWVIRRALQRQQAAERERGKEALRSRKVLETMSEAVLLLDAKGRIVFANEATARRLPIETGASFSAVLAASGLSLVTEDGNAYAIADPLSYICLESGQELDDAWLIESNPQKQMQWLAMRARPLLNDEGKTSGVLITLDDRTDEHERIADAEMSRTILAQMTDAVMITDARANILMVNTAYRRLSGFSEAELIGRQPSIVRSTRHDDAFWAGMWQTLAESKKWSGKVWNRRKDGSEYCVWHTVTSVCDLRGHVTRHVAVSRDITEQQVRERELWQRANFDPLTGLANRIRFEDQLAQTLTSAVRHQQRFAVCYLDLDHFKPVNDTLGHAAGDELLRQVAQRMRSILRKEDTLARVGGDEFILLMPRIASVDGAVFAAKKVLKAIDLPFVLEAGIASIGISLGIAIYPEHGKTAETLVAAADQALYAAKMGGRNTSRLALTDAV